MSTMNGIQHEAMRRAKRGDWALADALEVQHMCLHREALCGIAIGGRLRAFAFSEASEVPLFLECQACNGADECSWCGGEGSYFDTDLLWLDEGLGVRIVSLNGDAIPLGSLAINCDDIRTLDAAHAEIFGYAYDLEHAPRPMQAALFPNAKAA